MNDRPRQKLRELVDQYGQELVDNPRRCRALLLDYCSKYRREIFVLITAQEENVADDLQDMPDSVPLSMLMAQLTQRLVENRALARDAARWAVEAWAYALGFDVELQPVPDSPPEPAVEPPDAAPSATPPPLNAAPARNAAPQDQATPRDRAALPDIIPHTRDVFVSNRAIEVYGRARSKPDVPWRKLGKTPGKVGVPPNYVLGLRVSGVVGDAVAAWVQEVQYPQDVTSLDFTEKVTDAALAALHVFPKLTYLEFDNAERVTDAGLARLQKLRELVTLKLAWSSNIGDAGMDHLRALPRLAHLSVTWAGITDTGFTHLAYLNGLSSLALRECKHIEGTRLTELKALSHLRTLELAGGAQISDAGLFALSTLIGLTKLDLSRCPRITEQGVKYLRTLLNLAYLDLSWNERLSDAALEHLQALPNLSSLNLSRTPITNAGLRHLRDLHKLANLDLSGCEHITNRGLLPLRNLDKLTYLNLSDCRHINQRGIARLKQSGLYVVH